MSRDVYYHQHCPVCGRLLQIRVNLLGQRVYCQHCGGGFRALDEQMQLGSGEPSRSAADRADELLRQAALVLEQAGCEEQQVG
jgi:C4-type Zn-finger protein